MRDQFNPGRFARAGLVLVTIAMSRAEEMAVQASQGRSGALRATVGTVPATFRHVVRTAVSNLGGSFRLAGGHAISMAQGLDQRHDR